MSFFELVILLCFVLAWPFSIFKSLRSRQTAGKSLPFMLIILAGYGAGVVYKLLCSHDRLALLYLLNSLLVLTDILLYFRNERWQRKITQLKAKV